MEIGERTVFSALSAGFHIAPQRGRLHLGLDVDFSGQGGSSF